MVQSIRLLLNLIECLLSTHLISATCFDRCNRLEKLENADKHPFEVEWQQVTGITIGPPLMKEESLKGSVIDKHRLETHDENILWTWESKHTLCKCSSVFIYASQLFWNQSCPHLLPFMFKMMHKTSHLFWYYSAAIKMFQLMQTSWATMKHWGKVHNKVWNHYRF